MDQHFTGASHDFQLGAEKVTDVFRPFTMLDQYPANQKVRKSNEDSDFSTEFERSIYGRCVKPTTN